MALEDMLPDGGGEGFLLRYDLDGMKVRLPDMKGGGGLLVHDGGVARFRYLAIPGIGGIPSLRLARGTRLCREVSSSWQVFGPDQLLHARAVFPGGSLDVVNVHLPDAPRAAWTDCWESSESGSIDAAAGAEDRLFALLDAGCGELVPQALSFVDGAPLTTEIVQTPLGVALSLVEMHGEEGCLLSLSGSLVAADCWEESSWYGRFLREEGRHAPGFLVEHLLFRVRRSPFAAALAGAFPEIADGGELAHMRLINGDTILDAVFQGEPEMRELAV